MFCRHEKAPAGTGVGTEVICCHYKNSGAKLVDKRKRVMYTYISFPKIVKKVETNREAL